MTIKSASLTVLAGLLTFSSLAKDYQVKGPLLFRFDFPNRVPQTFLIDKNGDVVYHQFSASNDVRRALIEPKKLRDSKHHMSQFANILGEPISYNRSGYTLVEVIWDKPSRSMNCEPCDKQVKINTAYINGMQKKGIKVERSTIYVEFVKTFIQDWDD